jgi:hypothetical protein
MRKIFSFHRDLGFRRGTSRLAEPPPHLAAQIDKLPDRTTDEGCNQPANPPNKNTPIVSHSATHCTVHSLISTNLIYQPSAANSSFHISSMSRRGRARHFRQIDKGPALTACPLRSKSGKEQTRRYVRFVPLASLTRCSKLAPVSAAILVFGQPLAPPAGAWWFNAELRPSFQRSFVNESTAVHGSFNLASAKYPYGRLTLEGGVP